MVCDLDGGYSGCWLFLCLFVGVMAIWWATRWLEGTLDFWFFIFHVTYILVSPRSACRIRISAPGLLGLDYEYSQLTATGFQNAFPGLSAISVPSDLHNSLTRLASNNDSACCASSVQTKQRLE